MKNQYRGGLPERGGKWGWGAWTVYRFKGRAWWQERAGSVFERGLILCYSYALDYDQFFADSMLGVSATKNLI